MKTKMNNHGICFSIGTTYVALVVNVISQATMHDHIPMLH